MRRGAVSAVPEPGGEMAAGTCECWKIPAAGRGLFPVIPIDEGRLELLKEDLTIMGCLGFLHRPWNLKREEMIEELLTEASNQFVFTIRGRPKSWSSDLWTQVYFAPPKRAGLAERTDKYAVNRFRNPADPKDGYKASDYRDARNQQLLEFLSPIVYLEKPTRITVTMANTIFGALGYRKNPAPRPINWGWLIHSIMEKLAGTVSSRKTTPICPYLFDLYHFKEVLSELENSDYKKGESLLKYGLSLEEEPGYSESDEEEQEDIPKPQSEKKASLVHTGPHRK